MGEELDLVDELLQDPKKIKKLAEALSNVNKIFKELESARIALCFSILMNEDRERIMLRLLRYINIYNLLRRIYGKEEISKDIAKLLEKMERRCKEIYEIIYIDGRYRMIPRNSKVYHQLIERIDREYPYNPYK